MVRERFRKNIVLSSSELGAFAGDIPSFGSASQRLACAGCAPLAAASALTVPSIVLPLPFTRPVYCSACRKTDLIAIKLA